MYVLQIKIYIFLNDGIILQKKIFDHKQKIYNFLPNSIISYFKYR